ncbi:unnamed protein product [Ectocarpus fasciculatus]
MRGSHVGPGTFGCGRLGMLFMAFRFLQRKVGKKKKKGNHNNNRKHQGNPHGLPNNQPYASGQPQPYVSNAQHAGEEKVEEMPVAVGVPVEK